MMIQHILDHEANKDIFLQSSHALCVLYFLDLMHGKSSNFKYFNAKLHADRCNNRNCLLCLFICLFGVLRRFQHCTGHITTGSWKGRGNQYIEFARVVYCKLPTNGKQLPAFPLTAMTGIDPRPQRWEARVLPLCHREWF